MSHDLEGRRILLTRAAEDAATWATDLRARGALALEYPCLETRLLRGAAAEAREALAHCTWVVLASRRAVEALVELCPPPYSSSPAIACVGPATAARCEELLGPVDLVATGRSGRALARELHDRAEATDVLFLPAARDGRRDFEELFEASQLLRLAVYETVVVEGGEAPPSHDTVFFASPSAVEAFSRRVGRPAPGTLLVAIGRSTAEALAAHGWQPVVVASTPDLDGMVRATREHWRLNPALPRHP